jgi:hypothetical protein
VRVVMCVKPYRMLRVRRAVIARRVGRKDLEFSVFQCHAEVCFPTRGSAAFACGIKGSTTIGAKNKALIGFVLRFDVYRGSNSSVPWGAARRARLRTLKDALQLS